jgi:hypothetical protein
VLAGTLARRPASEAVNQTPTADSSDATAINPRTSQTPRRAATVSSLSQGAASRGYAIDRV